MSKYHFKDGEEVFHKDNLEKKLIVNRILKESYDRNVGVSPELPSTRRKAIRMIGIECHWWEKSEGGESTLCKHKFHSSELIPKYVGDKGVDAVIKWLEEQE